MDLKFTFSSPGSDRETHEHDDAAAPAGRALPLSTLPVSQSTELEIRVRRQGGSLVAEALSGDGVSYARAERAAASTGSAGDLASALRSAISRAVAGLEGPLADAVAAIVLELDPAEAALGELGFAAASEARPDGARFVTDEPFQRRTGVQAGTPVRT